MSMIRVHNTLIDPAKVSCIFQDQDDINHVTVVFDSGYILYFKGSEAMEIWKAFDKDGGWRDEDK